MDLLWDHRCSLKATISWPLLFSVTYLKVTREFSWAHLSSAPLLLHFYEVKQHSNTYHHYLFGVIAFNDEFADLPSHVDGDDPPLF